jgi:2-methylfumaryl-CoA isomerase
MLAEDPRVSESNPMFARIEHPGYGRFLTAGSPIEFTGAVRLAPAPAPRIGEQTAEVLREVLGLSQAQVEALQATAVVGGTVS